MTSPIMLWTDCETTGLSFEHDVVLEVGFKVTDKLGGVIDHFQSIVALPEWEDIVEDRIAEDEFVGPMHTKSGLWLDWKRGMKDPQNTPDAVQERVQEFFRRNGLVHGVQPMCGSSIHFDRDMFRVWLPGVEEFFSYRNIDMSTLKELCSMLSPHIWSSRQWTDKDKFHRVLLDIDHSLAEYRFYRNHFLQTEPANVQ